MGNLDHSNDHPKPPLNGKMPPVVAVEKEERVSTLLDKFVALDSKSLLAIGLVLGALGYWGAKMGMQSGKGTDPNQTAVENQERGKDQAESTLVMPPAEDFKFSMAERLREVFKDNAASLHAELEELSLHDALTRIHLPAESEILAYLDHVIALQKAVDVTNPSLSESEKRERYYQFLWENPGFSEEKTWSMVLLTDPASFVEYRVLAGFERDPEQVEPGPLINPWMPEQETQARKNR